MNTGRVAAAIAAVAVLGAAGWFGAEWWSGKPAPHATSQAVPDVSEPNGDQVTTLDAGAKAALAGSTPMAQRVAVVGLLNKRNSVSRDLTLKPGQAVRVGDTIVRLRACERTAPWEQQTLTGAFVQLDVNGADKAWRRVFSGWLYKERPQLNVVLHPVLRRLGQELHDVLPGDGSGHCAGRGARVQREEVGGGRGAAQQRRQRPPCANRGAEQRDVIVAVDLDRAERGEVRGHELTVEQGIAAGAQPRDEPGDRDL